MTPEEGVKRYLAHRKPGLRKSSMENAITRLNHFLDWCAEEDIDNLNELTGRKMALFVSWRRPQVKAITLQKQLSSVRMALRYWADIEAVEPGLAEKVHAPELPDGAEARQIQLPASRAIPIIEYLDRYAYASRKHVVMGLLWRTGMRTGTLRSIDLQDLEEEDCAIHVKHRPETDTPLKNGDDAERWIYLGPVWFEVIQEYIEVNRHDKVDDYGRNPLITTTHGRPHTGTIAQVAYRATQPCRYGECPHDRDPEECEAISKKNYNSKCPSSVGPHAVRRGSITWHLNNQVSPEVVSERANVSLDTMYKHYDARSPREKMAVRQRQLEGL